MSPKDNEEIRKQVQELLDKGLIRESLSSCAVPTVFAPKKGGEWRMCIYSRAINKITIRYRFPLPWMDDMMDCLSGPGYFLKIDLKSGYHLIRIREGDEWKTTFKTNEENELKLDPEKIATIISWPSPKTLFEVRNFHGLESFYRKFIRNFSEICTPMLDTIKKASQPYYWTKAAEKSFQILKKKITERLILRLPDFNKLFQVRCDASGTAIGSVLS
eukprot:PITA_19922